jgi:hypothetical protein
MIAELGVNGAGCEMNSTIISFGYNNIERDKKY